MTHHATTVRRTLAPLLMASLLAGVLPAQTVIAADTDGDGLSDRFEQRYGVTSPLRPDSDGDGVVDPAEDSDRDRLADGAEQRFGLDPARRDSDGDGVPDGREDHDQDGRSNAKEQEQRPVPAHVVPSLQRARSDRAVLARHCVASDDSAELLRCHDGDPASETDIVLLGDSHATMLLDPVRRAARNAGWRVTSMLKGACLPMPGMTTRLHDRLDGGERCRTWRQQALSAIRADPPELVVVAANDDAVLVDAAGRRVPRQERPARWRSGLLHLIEALPPRTRLLILGDVPDTPNQPLLCLKRHPDDMSRCTSRRKPLAQRPVERVQRTVAANRGQRFAALHDLVCPTDPCPLVQGRTLVWRSRGHLTATFARGLTPSLRRMLHDALEAGAR